MFIEWFPQVSENIQLRTGRPMAAEGPISRRGSGMRLATWDQWEQSEGEHDVKQKEGSARHRKKAGPVFLSGESHGQRSLAATVHGVTKSWTRLSDFDKATCQQYLTSCGVPTPMRANFRNSPKNMPANNQICVCFRELMTPD